MAGWYVKPMGTGNSSAHSIRQSTTHLGNQRSSFLPRHVCKKNSRRIKTGVLSVYQRARRKPGGRACCIAGRTTPTSVKKPAIPAWQEPCSSPYFFLYSGGGGRRESKPQPGQCVPVVCGAAQLRAGPWDTVQPEAGQGSLRNLPDRENPDSGAIRQRGCQVPQRASSCTRGREGSSRGDGVGGG